MSSLFDLSGRVAVVTGAGRGLGQGLALGLAEAGADVVLVVNRTAPDETVRKVEALGRKAFVVQADLSTEAREPSSKGVNRSSGSTAKMPAACAASESGRYGRRRARSG